MLFCCSANRATRHFSLHQLSGANQSQQSKLANRRYPLLSSMAICFSALLNSPRLRQARRDDFRFYGTFRTCWGGLTTLALVRVERTSRSQPATSELDPFSDVGGWFCCGAKHLVQFGGVV